MAGGISSVCFLFFFYKTGRRRSCHPFMYHLAGCPRHTWSQLETSPDFFVEPCSGGLRHDRSFYAVSVWVLVQSWPAAPYRPCICAGSDGRVFWSISCSEILSRFNGGDIDFKMAKQRKISI